MAQVMTAGSWTLTPAPPRNACTVAAPACPPTSPGHGGVGRGVEHLGPVADDPGLLDFGPDHEPGDVHQVDQRDAVGIDQIDESGRLVGGVVVEDSPELAGLVGHNPRRTAAEAGQA